MKNNIRIIVYLLKLWKISGLQLSKIAVDAYPKVSLNECNKQI